MNRFKKHTIVAAAILPLLVIGMLMNSKVAAQGGPPSGVSVNIMNPVPLPATGTVTGNVAATQSGAWNVGIAGKPSVSIANPATAPAFVIDLSSAMGTLVRQFCLLGSTNNPSGAECSLFTVPEGSRLIIQSVSAYLSRVNTGVALEAGFTQSGVVGNASHWFLPLLRQASDSLGDYFAGQATVNVYADPNDNITCHVQADGLTLFTTGLFDCTLSGQLVKLPQ